MHGVSASYCRLFRLHARSTLFEKQASVCSRFTVFDGLCGYFIQAFINTNHEVPTERQNERDRFTAPPVYGLSKPSFEHHNLNTDVGSSQLWDLIATLDGFRMQRCVEVFRLESRNSDSLTARSVRGHSPTMHGFRTWSFPRREHQRWPGK